MRTPPMGSVPVSAPKRMSTGVYLPPTRPAGPCRDRSRIYGHRCRAKLGKPRALRIIVRHRSRKKRQARSYSAVDACLCGRERGGLFVNGCDQLPRLSALRFANECFVLRRIVEERRKQESEGEREDLSFRVGLILQTTNQQMTAR